MKKKKVSTKSQIVCEFNFYNSAKRLRRLNIYEKSRCYTILWTYII